MRSKSEKQKSDPGSPDLRPPSRTSKILTPVVVVTTVAVLALASIIGILVAVSIFSSQLPYPRYIGVSEAFITIASVVSVLYLFLHCLAAVYNNPVGLSRPPKHKTHVLCFIVARLALVAWMIALITSSAVISKPSICQNGGRNCRLQIVDVVASALAFIACGIILTALESCQHPFQGLRPCTGATCQVSSLGDDDIGQHISSGCSSIEENSTKSDKIRWQNDIKRKPVPTTPVRGELPQEYPMGHPLTPLLPLPLRTKPKREGWGQEWKHLADEAGAKPTTLSKSLSVNSISSNRSLSSISNFSTSDPGSGGTVPKRQGHPRTVTPSSSISNRSRRSPLSTMRSAEFPDVVIRPELYLLPPKIPAPHEWSTSRTDYLQQLLPVTDLGDLQRRPSGMQRRPSATVAPLSIRKHGRNQPLGRPAMDRPVRRTTEVGIPGAYIDYRVSPEDKAKVDEHARKIEVESLRSVARSQSVRASNMNATRLARGESGQMYPPRRVDSRTRYRDTRQYWPGPQRCSTVCGLRQNPPDTAMQKRVPQHGNSAVKQLRRLTLGDIDVKLGKLWDV